MTWRDKLVWAEIKSELRKKASFRGAKFFVRDVDFSVGRRNVVHQYPLRDDPFVEDLGQDTEDFTIEGYVVQNEDNDFDYIQERDTLIKALKTEGPGTLIHPFYGNIIVALVGKAKIAESFREGGIARFSMSFVRAEKEESPYPAESIDYVESVDQAAEDALDLGNDGFGATYLTDDVSSYVEESTSNIFDSLKAMMTFAMSAVSGLSSFALDILSLSFLGINLASILSFPCRLANSIGSMFDSFDALIGDYEDISFDSILGGCSGRFRGTKSGPMSGAQVNASETGGFLGSTVSNPASIPEDYGKAVVRVALEVNKFGEDPSGSNASQYGGAIAPVRITTESRARQSVNQEALINLIRLNALIAACKAAIRIAYTSHNAVIEMMDEIVSAIDTQLLKLGDDASDTSYDIYNVTASDPNTFEALESLRANFIKAMISIGANLADIVEYIVPPDTMPSLVLAYDKYKDLGRESEIITRNIGIVKHPGFLPGGVSLEVLSK